MKYILPLTLTAFLLAGCSVVAPQQTAIPTPAPTAPPSASATPEAMQGEQSGKKAGFTLADIAKHATAEDCWFAVEGKVYDVTGYIKQQRHPGGAAILQGCGKDATQLFNNRPGEGTPHSDRARQGLSQYLIGDLISE